MADVGDGLFYGIQAPGTAVLDRPNPISADTVAKQSGSSLVTSWHNAHKEVRNATTELVPCAGWLRERCSHNNYRWIPLRCHRWKCPTCGVAKREEFRERLEAALDVAIRKGWTLKFVTLTWAADVALERVRLDLQHFAQWVRRRYGKEAFEYAKVPEFTKRGRIHLHLAVVMPYIHQSILAAAWKKYSKAPIADIRAVTDVLRLRNELAKYLAKAPAGKVTYSRNFPKVESIKVDSGPCEPCDGQEHSFEHVSEHKLSETYPFEEHGRLMPGEPIYEVPCRCWGRETRSGSERVSRDDFDSVGGDLDKLCALGV